MSLSLSNLPFNAEHARILLEVMNAGAAMKLTDAKALRTAAEAREYLEALVAYDDKVKAVEKADLGKNGDATRA